ncbi:hypothetical protein KJ865_15220, partial [Myxococcota bacterium]|nr:hypothetical protein [Myxococcota bacterium]
MFTRKLTFLIALVTVVSFSYDAYGACSPKALAKLKKLHKAAKDDYDQMEFSSARKTLEDSISIARREGCDETLEYANILVDLGIFYITDPDNPDVDRGKGRFKKALKINPCAKIGDNLKTPRLQKILDKVRRSLGVKCKGSTTKVDPTVTPPSTDPPVKKGNDVDEEDTGS